MAARALAFQCMATAICIGRGAPAMRGTLPTVGGGAGEGSVARVGQQRQLASPEGPDSSTFPKVVLRSSTISLAVWPPAPNSSALAYYKSTRFDWGTMMSDLVTQGTTLFASSFWRAPQDPQNPESGVGLAAEFGCGEPGARCAAGWAGHPGGSSNGVLGYEDAAEGQPFLKIGVGKLIRQSAGDYSPFDTYQFAEFPRWSVCQAGESAITMASEESLDDQWAYRLTRSTTVSESGVTLQTTLENRGSRAFSTPHYSHNLLSVNRTATGPPLCIRMVPDVNDAKEPGVEQGWANPSSSFFAPAGAGELCATASVDGKVKMEFGGAANQEANATWSAWWGGRRLLTRATEVVRRPLYRYNFYSESTTASPEPMQMIALGPGESATWSSFLEMPQW